MNEYIETWFRMRNELMREPGLGAAHARPPSLRDACYAEIVRRDIFRPSSNPATIEAYVNSLELAAMKALSEAWVYRTRPELEK